MSYSLSQYSGQIPYVCRRQCTCTTNTSQKARRTKGKYFRYTYLPNQSIGRIWSKKWAYCGGHQKEKFDTPGLLKALPWAAWGDCGESFSRAQAQRCESLAPIPHGPRCRISVWTTWDLCVPVSNPLIKSRSVCLDHFITFWSTPNTLLRISKVTSDTFAGPQTGQRIALQLEREGLYLCWLLWRGLTRWIENIIGERGL